MSAAIPSLASDWHYPLLNLFWTMLLFFLWIMWFFLLFKIIGDVFRSQDLSGWGKAGWTIFLVLVPFLAALVYLIARGSDMATRDAKAAAAANEARQTYIRSVANSSTGTAEELSKLADLHQRGVLTQTEFDAQKAKLLA
jgi:hypothetical protein